MSILRTGRNKIELAVACAVVVGAVVALPTGDQVGGERHAVAEDSQNEGEARLLSADTALPSVSRDEIMARARFWYEASNSDPGFVRDLRVYPPDPDGKGYRSDCSGLVSMAWRLPLSYSTGTLPEVSHPLGSLAELRRGDILLARKDAGHRYGHVAIFDRWADATMTTYWAYDHGDGSVKYGVYRVERDGDSREYLPYRYDVVVDLTGAPADVAQPVGDVDKLTGGEGMITVRGWAADPDTPTTSTSVHVYLTAPAGGRTLVANLPAQEDRADIARTHPRYGAAHGFTAVLEGVAAGRYRVEVFAIDSSGAPDDHTWLNHAGPRVDVG
ncbi:MAG: hypothetical protein GEV28_12885 [Actinophytocola sp.]|uniref:hypothetical protein n=1 Tax=Actinophytocola sp. TaxID=1872138 RepID=UPI00132697C0|nr:hypothetical protein [Actinophytocola sp.]MPZ81235.1 hypothetical protein [Actinophytocola sp.]